MQRKMVEKDVESYLVRKCKEAGIQCYKFTSPSNAGVPDRILIGYDRVIFVELKRPGGKPRELQLRTFRRMRQGGADVRVIDTRELCLDLIKEMMNYEDAAVGVGWDM